MTIHPFHERGIMQFVVYLDVVRPRLNAGSIVITLCSRTHTGLVEMYAASALGFCWE